MTGVITAMGLMSGASMDGIDVALVATDGERQLTRGQSLTFPYSSEQRARLREAAAAAWRIWGGEGGGEAPSDRELLADVEAELTRLHADAVKDFLEADALPRDEVALIAFPGQTVYHDASGGLTRQLGDGELLARLTGIDVVYDFRAADMEAGGEGVRMVAVYYRALADAAGLERPVAVVTIGGTANVTFIGEDGSLIAFDVGPSVTAEAIARTRAFLPSQPLAWLLAGAGARNATLVEALRGLLAGPLYRADEMGWPADHLEAEAFAYLAVRSIKKLPLSFPGTTGVRQPITGGRLARAPRR